MQRTVPLRSVSPLNRISPRRLLEQQCYAARRERFLQDHPFCQLWLAEHGIKEAWAIHQRGVLRFGPGRPPVFVPRSATIHHTNKRRGRRLLDEQNWMAVSWCGHRTIECNKTWARERGYLAQF